MSPDRKTEIIEQAAEIAVFFLALVEGGMSAVDATSLSGSWMFQQRFPDMDDDVIEGDEWKKGNTKDSYPKEKEE